MWTNADKDLYTTAATQDSVFTINDARRAGLTRDQIEARRRKLWTPIHRGVYVVPGVALSTRGRMRAACFAGEPNAAASHRAGAALYEVPGGNHTLAEVNGPRHLRMTGSGLIVHETKRIDPGDIRRIDGIPVMRPERVLIELASIYKSPKFIETVLHAMMRKKLVTIDSTVGVFKRLARRGRPGIAVTRAVLEQFDASVALTESPPETKLLHILRNAGLGRVVPQMKVYDKHGNFVARVDIGLPDLRATVEYDSDQEHGDLISIGRDNDRRNRVFAAEWTPFVARRHDLATNCVALISAIKAHTRSESA
jgi:hypothetical protein